MPFISAPSGPIVPDSLAGIYRSSMSIIETAKVTQCGWFSSTLLLVLLVSYFYHSFLGFPAGSFCVTPTSIDSPVSYIVSLFTPFSFVHLVLLCLLLLVFSVTLEKQVGSIRLASVFLGNSIALCVLVAMYYPGLCFPGTHSVGPVLASLTAMLHGMNVRIFTEGLSGSIRVPFSVEPRWHCWILLLLLTMTADNDTLVLYAFAVAVGAVPYMYQLGLFVWNSGRISVDFAIFFASIFLLPFPLSGPTLFELRTTIVRDAVSLVGVHWLLSAPFFYLAHPRFRTWLLVPMLLGWVYGTQAGAFSLPAIAGLVYTGYRIVAAK